jgi:hypothetical protein
VQLPTTGYQAGRTRRTYVVRGAMLTCICLVCAVLLRSHGSELDRWLMVVPCLLCLLATRDAVRSMHISWDLHHGGVLFLLYADMMLLTLIAVWTVWPR